MSKTPEEMLAHHRALMNLNDRIRLLGYSNALQPKSSLTHMKEFRELKEEMRGLFDPLDRLILNVIKKTISPSADLLMKGYDRARETLNLETRMLRVHIWETSGKINVSPSSEEIVEPLLHAYSNVNIDNIDRVDGTVLRHYQNAKTGLSLHETMYVPVYGDISDNMRHNIRGAITQIGEDLKELVKKPGAFDQLEKDLAKGVGRIR